MGMRLSGPGVLAVVLIGCTRLVAEGLPSGHPDANTVPDTVLSRDAILSLMLRVSRHMEEHLRLERDCSRAAAAYDIGLVGLYRMTRDPNLLDRISHRRRQGLGERGDAMLPADPLIQGQADLELALLGDDTSLAGPVVQWFLSKIAANACGGAGEIGITGRSVADPLFFAPSMLVMLARISGEDACLEPAHAIFQDARLRFFDPGVGLFHEEVGEDDETVLTGRKIFSSHINGWALAGIVRIIRHLPRDDPQYDEYLSLFRTMSDAILDRQGIDGFWRARLDDPPASTAPETFGTASFTFALAWGIHNQMIDKPRFIGPVRKAWKALTASVDEQGCLRRVEPIGSVADASRHKCTSAQAAGMLLLAGEQMAKLPPPRPTGRPPAMAPASVPR